MSRTITNFEGKHYGLIIGARLNQIPWGISKIHVTGLPPLLGMVMNDAAISFIQFNEVTKDAWIFSTGEGQTPAEQGATIVRDPHFAVIVLLD